MVSTIDRLLHIRQVEQWEVHSETLIHRTMIADDAHIYVHLSAFT